MKRLAYLRAEAAETVDSFEESVNEIESRIDGKEKTSASDAAATAEEDNKIPVNETSTHIARIYGKIDESTSQIESKELPIEESHNDGDEVRSHYKRLWRTVARLTHPDVVGNNDELVALYKAASSAYERDRRAELLDAAAEVNAQLDNPHPKMFEDVERRCVHYESMIRKIRESVAWQWKNAQEGTKNEIVDLIKARRVEKKQSSH
jgi:hypothetical protein